MSKKRRKQAAEEFLDFADLLTEMIEDAQEYLSEATPYEISLELSELGVKTSHREGAYAFMRNWKPDPNDPDPVSPFEALGEHWENEITASRGEEPELEDGVFLTEVARYFWLTMNQSTSQDPAGA